MAGYVAIAAMAVGAYSESQEKNKEAKEYKREAALVTEEGLAETERIEHEGKNFEANQRLSYLKNGVSLRGSPLLVLADTQEEVGKQAEANTRRTFANRKKLRGGAKQSRSAGRAAIVKGAASAYGQTQKKGQTNGG